MFMSTVNTQTFLDQRLFWFVITELVIPIYFRLLLCEGSYRRSLKSFRARARRISASCAYARSSDNISGGPNRGCTYIIYQQYTLP